MTLESIKALKLLENEGISVELIDLRTIKPLDHETILNSVRKTGRLIVADHDWKSVGLASEIITLVAEELYDTLKAAPLRITYPDRLVPTSWALSNHFYPSSKNIASSILKMMGKQHAHLLQQLAQELRAGPIDTPYKEFCGPF
jgi:pyruvate dehydrogenase E1 component beta subunit